MKIIQSTKIYY